MHGARWHSPTLTMLVVVPFTKQPVGSVAFLPVGVGLQESVYR